MAGINGDSINSFPINGLGDADEGAGQIEWVAADFFLGASWSFGILAPEGGEVITVPGRDTSMVVCHEDTAMVVPCIERHMSLPIERGLRHMVVPATAEGCSE